jgi:hypothetical protein
MSLELLHLGLTNPDGMVFSCLRPQFLTGVIVCDCMDRKCEELVMVPVYTHKRVVCGVPARTDKQVSQAMVLRSVTSESSIQSRGSNAYGPWHRS